jgi:hypothetical protein
VDLKSQVESLKESGNLNVDSIKDLKTQLKQTVDDIKSLSANLNKQLKSQGNNLNDSADSAEDINDLGTPEKQHGKWHDSESDIVTQILDPKGNSINLDITYEKVTDGKFNLKISPNAETKPGIYKIISTITVNGEEHTVESEFAWGLVSLNTKKSIYKPGETADFEIVVLDSQGHPVCDANLTMNITDPTNGITTLQSGTGILPDTECGLYSADYITSTEGTYNIFIHANANGIDTDFNTTFDVKSSYDFDIIRTAQSKIDPTIGPNLFDVKIDVESFIGQQSITIQESVPAVFDFQTEADITTIGDN